MDRPSTQPIGDSAAIQEAAAKLAVWLVDQRDEPWPAGTDIERLHYWRDKAISAAAALAALAELSPVKKSVSPDECRRDLQALGAAISRRCWQSAESAYNALRDRIGQ